MTSWPQPRHRDGNPRQSQHLPAIRAAGVLFFHFRMSPPGYPWHAVLFSCYIGCRWGILFDRKKYGGFPMTQITAYFDSRRSGGCGAGDAAALRNGLQPLPYKRAWRGLGCEVLCERRYTGRCDAAGPRGRNGCRRDEGNYSKRGRPRGGRPGGLLLEA